MKFFKRLFVFILIIGFALLGSGYYYGLRTDNADIFIADLIDDINSIIEDYRSDKSDEEKEKQNTELIPKDEKIAKKDTKYKLLPLPKNPYYSVDKHARKCPVKAAKDISSLAKYLSKGAKSDLQKARSIYVWLTENISYDDKGYNSGNYSDCDALSVLQNKTSVCEGYAELFLTLGLEMGLEIEKIHGYAKGYGYSSGDKFNDTDHAWNIIKINNKWRVFDATWGRGFGKNVNGNLVSKKDFNEYWFNVDPYESIFNHLPDDFDKTFVSRKIDLKIYERMPYIDNEYFQLGFNGKNTLTQSLKSNKLSTPKCYGIDTYVKVTKAPNLDLLNLDESYYFELYVPKAYKIAIIDAENNWTYFEREKGVFSLNYTPNVKGEIKISAKIENGGDSYHTIMIYKARANQQIS